MSAALGDQSEVVRGSTKCLQYRSDDLDVVLLAVCAYQVRLAESPSLHNLHECGIVSPVEPVDPRVRLAIARWPDDAPRGSVTTFCLEHGVSRKTFYAIRKRVQLEGQAAALEPRSRRPAASPNRISADVQIFRTASGRGRPEAPTRIVQRWGR
jgi:hypothetical protein